MMTERWISFAALLALCVLLLAACSSAPTPAATSTPAPTKAASPPAVTPISSANRASSSPGTESAFEMQSNSGGSVTVDVKPAALRVGEPVAFDIAMNTHSVDLGDDMTKIAILRDDASREYNPVAWEGPGGGGHHRSGTLKFAPLVGKPKYIELVIKGLAKVPERVFRWELP